MKLKLLAAVASVAFVATGASYAQDNANRDRHPEQQQQRVEPHGAAAAPRAEAPRTAQEPAQAQQRNAQTEPRREEPKTGQMEKPAAAPRNAQTEPRREEPKTGQMEKPANAPRNAQGEMRREEPKTGQMEKPANAPRNAQGEMRREEPRTGQTETRQPGAAPRNAEMERRNGVNGRTAQHEGAPRVQGHVNMSAEHATRVGEVLRERGGAERVNFNVRVGERVPENIEIRPLPEEVISLVPEYRGYDYFVDSDDEIVFVSPETHEIVGSIDYSDGPVVAGARPCPVEN